MSSLAPASAPRGAPQHDHSARSLDPTDVSATATRSSSSGSAPRERAASEVAPKVSSWRGLTIHHGRNTFDLLTDLFTSAVFSGIGKLITSYVPFPAVPAAPAFNASLITFGSKLLGSVFGYSMIAFGILCAAAAISNRFSKDNKLEAAVTFLSSLGQDVPTINNLLALNYMVVKPGSLLSGSLLSIDVRDINASRMQLVNSSGKPFAVFFKLFNINEQRFEYWIYNLSSTYYVTPEIIEAQRPYLVSMKTSMTAQEGALLEQLFTPGREPPAGYSLNPTPKS